MNFTELNEFLAGADLKSLILQKERVESQITKFGPTEESTFALLQITNAIEAKKLAKPKTLDDLQKIIYEVYFEEKGVNETKRTWVVAKRVNAIFNLGLE